MPNNSYNMSLIWLRHNFLFYSVHQMTERHMWPGKVSHCCTNPLSVTCIKLLAFGGRKLNRIHMWMLDASIVCNGTIQMVTLAPQCTSLYIVRRHTGSTAKCIIYQSIPIDIILSVPYFPISNAKGVITLAQDVYLGIHGKGTHLFQLVYFYYIVSGPYPASPMKGRGWVRQNEFFSGAGKYKVPRSMNDFVNI